MTNIKAVSFTPNTFVDSKKEANVRKYELVENPQAINKSLLALAAIGLATLSSCSQDSYLGPDLDEFQSKVEIGDSTRVSFTNPPVMLNERVDNIFKALGILNDTTSLSDVKTISCRDNKDIRHWIKPTNVFSNVVYGKGMSLLPDDSAGEIYSFQMTSAQNGGVNVEKVFNDGIVQKFNYLQKDDGSVVEYEVFDKNFKAEKSVYKKLEDGNIERTFSDGSTIVYGDIKQDFPYPTAITFDGCVTEDYEQYEF